MPWGLVPDSPRRSRYGENWFCRRSAIQATFFVTPKSGGILYFGEAINQLLFSTGSDRLSFLSLAVGTLSSRSELPDIGELLRHVTQSIGSESFGRPRVPPSVDIPELPRAALARTWGKAAQVLEKCRLAEWPALLGATAHTIVQANRALLAPPLSVKIMLEAAAPMSKLDPTTVEGSGVPAPSFENWSMRALRPENNQAIVADVRAVMPVMPATAARTPPVIARPRIAFLNLGGAPYATMVAEDRAVIGELFGRNVQVATASFSVTYSFSIADWILQAKLLERKRRFAA